MKALERTDRLRMVELESPIDNWEHPQTESLFGKIASLKVRGYGAEYRYGIMPMDSTDMIATHLLVCEETEDGLRPLTGYKSISLRKCEQYKLSFPGLSIPQAASAHQHVKAVERIIAQTQTRGGDLHYAGGWTIDPRERHKGEWSKLLRDMYWAMYTLFYIESPNVAVVAGATLRFKVDAYLKWLGHEALRDTDETLAPINVVHLGGEPVLWTVMKQVALEPRIEVRKWLPMWSDRIVIRLGVEEKKLKISA